MSQVEMSWSALAVQYREHVFAGGTLFPRQ